MRGFLTVGPAVIGVALAMMAAGCSVDTGARAGVQKVEALDHPLVRGTRVRADYLDGDKAFVYVADDATDADARRVWCDVMIPSGLSEELLRVDVAAENQTYLWPEPADCNDPNDVPKREAY